MTDKLVILDGSTFFVSDSRGDTHGEQAEGFFHDDMRHLSLWELQLGGQLPKVLAHKALRYYLGQIVATIPAYQKDVQPQLILRRSRIVAAGFHEHIEIENHSQHYSQMTLQLRFGADFADILEIGSPIYKQGELRTELEPDGQGVRLSYQNGEFRRATLIRFSQPCELEENSATFQIRLHPRSRWLTCADILCEVDGEVRRVRGRCRTLQQPDSASPNKALTVEEWLREAPEVRSYSDSIERCYRRSLTDLAALRFRPSSDLAWSLPAAGLPWFMALFGRDSLIASYHALPFLPRLARTTLEALAALQAKEFDDFRDAEPGKIPHEMRKGELASLGFTPHNPYYGSHDATLLFLILLDEYNRWTGDDEFVRSMEVPARAALNWLTQHADLDRDGYVEYRSRSSHGLRNQGWKDSRDAIAFQDGKLAEPPVATCELQGYAYDSRMRMARVAREIWRDGDTAARLEMEGEELKFKFNEAFWSADRGLYGLALDAGKRLVDTRASNMGHLLWSGIVDQSRAASVADSLLHPESFSGWGIRTLAEGEARYNPIGYHTGSVWPHDTAIIAEGLRRYGFHAEAAELALTIIEAAEHFEYQLPELFSGLARRETTIPVECPNASRPQAWATTAPLSALRTLLGADPSGERLVFNPQLPRQLNKLTIERIPFRGRMEAVSV